MHLPRVTPTFSKCCGQHTHNYVVLVWQLPVSIEWFIGTQCNECLARTNNANELLIIFFESRDEVVTGFTHSKTASFNEINFYIYVYSYSGVTWKLWCHKSLKQTLVFNNFPGYQQRKHQGSTLLDFCKGNPPGARNVENASMSLHHHIPIPEHNKT